MTSLKFSHLSPRPMYSRHLVASRGGIELNFVNILNQRTQNTAKHWGKKKTNTKCCNNVTSSQRCEPETTKRWTLQNVCNWAQQPFICLVFTTVTKICFGGKAREGRSLLGRSFAHWKKTICTIFIIQGTGKSFTLPVLCAEPRLSLLVLIF